MERKGSFPLVGIALDTPIRPKKNRAGTLKIAKAKIRRVTDRATESMVKVTGGVHGAKHLKQHMDYISRNGKIDLENERGEVIDNLERLREEHKQWSQELGKPRANERDTINLVLSMPPGTDPEAVRRAARAFAKEQFGETNQYLMALHHPGNDEKTKQPHVHLTVKARGFDGEKLDPKKAELQEWREAWAEKMRAQGFNVEATTRRSRGVVQKGTRHVVRAIQEDTKRPGRGKVQTAKIREAADDLAGKPVSRNPHREQIVKTQNAIRKAWLEGAATLEKSDEAEDKILASKIRKFVAEMPRQLQDERAKIRAALQSEIEAKRQKEAGQNAPQKPDVGRVDHGRER